MKNLFILNFLFIFIFSIQSKAQQPIDTLNYVKQFEINKVNFIGKPFSYLLSNMTQIRPQTVNSLPQVYGKDLTPESIFNFTEEERQYGRITVSMIITWQTPLSHSQAFLLSQQNHFNFTAIEELFYSDKLIGDIKVYKR